MPSWKKILQSGSAIHVLNITASGLPNTTQANIVGYNPTTGQFTYFLSSSITSSCITPFPVITVNGANFYDPSPSGSHFTPQFTRGFYGCSGSVYLEAANLNAYNFTPTYQWYNSSNPPTNPILNATESRYYPSASGQYSVKINDNTCEAYSTHENVELLPPDTFSTGSVSANQTVTVGTPITPITWNITTNPAADANPNASNNGYTPNIIVNNLPPGLRLETTIPFSSGSAQVQIVGTPSAVPVVGGQYWIQLSPSSCYQIRQYPFSIGVGLFVVNAATTPYLFISGSVKYDNTAQTPMTNTTLELRTTGSNSVRVATTNTDSNGDYIFGVNSLTHYSNQPLPTGTYEIRATTIKPWGGVNAVDALAVARSFTGAAPLSGIRLKASDVNGSNTVNSLDALTMTRRFSGLIASFTAGDWVFASSSGADLIVNWNIQSQSAYCDIKALSYGDINRSYVPNIAL
jgi:hypothetical protein